MRIAVIGAGPAGLSAAVYAVQQGHEVRVYEREARVGGKCKSLVVDGVAYDVGANLITPRYTRILAWARELGLELDDTPERNLLNLTTEDVPELGDVSLLERVMLRGGASLYVFARRLSLVHRPGLAGLRRGVQGSFGQWLTRHGLGALRPVFAQLFIAYGYGLMDELPAAYALKFFDPVHLRTALQTVLGANPNTSKSFRQGFQGFWEALAAHYGLDLVLSSDVRRVERSGRCVRVHSEEHGVAALEEFDRLVVACPLDSALSFLDGSPEERELFGQLKYNEYYVTAARVSGAVDESYFVYPYSREFTPGQPTVFYAPRPGTGVVLFYAYGGGDVSRDELHANLGEAVRALGGQLEELISTERWRYFPHVDVATMRGGFYDRVDALQGQLHTVYVGEALSFPLVELVAEHAEKVVSTHLSP